MALRLAEILKFAARRADPRSALSATRTASFAILCALRIALDPETPNLEL